MPVIWRADGNYPFTLVNGKYVTEEKRNNSGIYSWQGEATLYHTFKDDSELDVKGYYFYSRRGLPGAVTLYNPLSDETLWDENTFVQARYRKHFSPRWSLQAQAKYNHGWNKYKDEGKEYTDGYYREKSPARRILYFRNRSLPSFGSFDPFVGAGWGDKQVAKQFAGMSFPYKIYFHQCLQCTLPARMAHGHGFAGAYCHFGACRERYGPR